MSKRGSESSTRVKSGGGGGAGAKEKELFTVGKDGVKTYKETDEGVRAFFHISDNVCIWNKGFDVLEGDKRPVSMKRSQQWDYLKNHNINEFRLEVAKGQEKRALKQMEDYGYHVVAKRAANENATALHHTVYYYMSKKKMQRLGLDFKVETYWKKGWKG